MIVLAVLYISLGFGALTALTALGFAALCLGPSFTQAVGTLCAVMQDAGNKMDVILAA